MNFDKFTNLQSLSKTLRFELKPVGETADYIDDFKSNYLKELINVDTQRDKNYQKVKKLIDQYHKTYINEKLKAPIDPKSGELFISPEDFEDAYSYYQNLKIKITDEDSRTKLEKARTDWQKTQTELRKKIAKSFTEKEHLFKKELITKDLPLWLKKNHLWEDNKESIESFNSFTTHFTGFHENRKNIYTAEEKSTSITFRLINDNLPKFFANCDLYKKIKEKYPQLQFNIDTETFQKLNISSLDEAFQPRFFINLFTQHDIEVYLELLGGKSTETGEKQQGLNEQINLFKQHNKEIDKLPKFTLLYKQILSDREGNSFIPEAFINDKELLNAMAEYIALANQKNGTIDALKRAMQLLTTADLSQVYVKSSEFGSISNILFNSYSIITTSLWHHAETALYPTPSNGKASKKLITQRESFTKQTVFSLQEIDHIVFSYIQQLPNDDPLKSQTKTLSTPTQPIYSYLCNAIEKTKIDLNFTQCLEQIQPTLKLHELNKNRQLPKDDTELGGDGFQQVQTIQKTLDAHLAIGHALKSLHLVKNRKPIDIANIDHGFYNEFVSAFESFFQPSIELYNKVRNHLTKKPFSKQKIKINFDNPTLLDGWDANKETDNSCILFEKEGLYYLGIMHPKHKQLFNCHKGIDDLNNEKKCQKKDGLYKKITASTSEPSYRKIIYKLLPGVNKMLPKVFFSNSRIDYFSPSNEILEIRNTASHSKNGKPQTDHKKSDFNLSDCHSMIDFYKASIAKHHEWKQFDFQFKPTNAYQDLSGFYKDIEQQGYKIDFHNIKQSYIDECVNQGKLFLFQIYNKDFSPYSKGKKNLHTLYWLGLFEEENLKDTVLKLNGQAEIFYRPHSLKKSETTIHKKEEAINNKNPNNPKAQSLFKYDIIKDRRYTKDKFMFHVPITLNYKASNAPRFNDMLNAELAKHNNTHVIGIDRGERHLLYYSVINNQGKIIDQGTLNTITTDQGINIDYHQKLDEKEKQRNLARKSWSTIENIKELKQGYLSQIVHKLSELIIKYNAIVCLEDLNFGFKRGRFKFEKQVYQKFEKALIDKLNYLVFKERKNNEPGHYLNAYQLTDAFKSFKDLGKQTGILYYVAAAYTSKTCPRTGFANFLNTRYQSVEKSQSLFNKFESIKYNKQKNHFEFRFDYKVIYPDRAYKNTTTQWTACTHGEKRLKNIKDDKGQWKTIPINVSEELKKLFDNAQINHTDGNEIKHEICTNQQTKFHKKLLTLLGLTLNLRHSEINGKEDFILSPIADKQGEFFDSRIAKNNEPKDADANGAYHIALKGLWNLQQIHQHDWSVDKPKRLNLAMKNEQWFSFVQQRPFEKN